ncbi:hypothetical protein HELRODRAFT_163682 [Helobdella robusta]|uniref:Uncharacterized protein n=1 Tax=Helobdella robusta TaxID=6412 RepID=T1EUC7_HELRO|nr:hypothetical protein HELRODRAFT_163682 [Helobdella robusta]ESN96598.1 hypothetical protein HELRODRAFT_163682 [Helobdella robusta]
MPRGGGVHTTKRLSGCQQRKAKIKKDEILSTLRGSMMQYVKGSDEAQSSSKDTVLNHKMMRLIYLMLVCKIELLLEIPRLRRYLKAAEIDLEEAKDWSVLDILKFIVEWDFLESLSEPTIISYNLCVCGFM